MSGLTPGPIYPWRKSSHHQLNRKLSWPGSGSGRFVHEIIILHLKGFELWIIQLVAQSLQSVSEKTTVNCVERVNCSYKLQQQEKSSYVN